MAMYVSAAQDLFTSFSTNTTPFASENVHSPFSPGLQGELTPPQGPRMSCDSGLANQNACIPPALLIGQG